jgi:glycosyltransferase involved in cell wall biosynthesis
LDGLDGGVGMSPKRIFIVLTTKWEAGGEFQYANAVLEAVSAWDPREYEACGLVLEKSWEKIVARCGLRQARVSWLRTEEMAQWLESTRLSVAGGGAFRRRLHPAFLAAALQRPDIVIIPDQYSLDLPGGVRQIACIHDLMHRHEPHFPEVGDPEEEAAREARFKTLLKRCHGVLVDSEIGKQHVLEAYSPPADKLFIMPFIVYSGLKNAVPVRPDSLPGNADGGYLFYPAQFWLHKNHQGLLEAAARLRSRLDLHCVFTGGSPKNGDGPFRQAVARLRLEERVHCLGHVTEGELAWLYIHARCLVMPTFFGPTNIPPLEAMHFGCPVGVSGIYGMPEQLGDAPLYFNPESVEEMAETIETLWLDGAVRDRCIKRGFAVAARHSPENFSRRLKAVIDRVGAMDGGVAQAT